MLPKPVLMVVVRETALLHIIQVSMKREKRIAGEEVERGKHNQHKDTRVIFCIVCFRQAHPQP